MGQNVNRSPEINFRWTFMGINGNGVFRGVTFRLLNARRRRYRPDLHSCIDSVYSRHLCGIPPNLHFPPPKKTAAKLCALNLSYGRDNELQIYHRNLLIKDNKRMTESNGVIHFTSPAVSLPVHRDQLRAQRSLTSMGKLF